jgi:hypothetical protein
MELLATIPNVTAFDGVENPRNARLARTLEELYFLLHKNTGVLVGDHMKKRAFLLPLAASLAALVGAEAQASVPAATLPISQPAMEGPAIAGPRQHRSFCSDQMISRHSPGMARTRHTLHTLAIRLTIRRARSVVP